MADVDVDAPIIEMIQTLKKLPELAVSVLRDNDTEPTILRKLGRVTDQAVALGVLAAQWEELELAIAVKAMAGVARRPHGQIWTHAGYHFVWIHGRLACSRRRETLTEELSSSAPRSKTKKDA